MEVVQEPMIAPSPADIALSPVDINKVRAMIEACRTGNLHMVQEALTENVLYACQQDEESGMSPLMAAAAVGNIALCQYLLETGGAPWNAVDRQGKCAGDYATENQHWHVVNLLVDWGVRAELILGRIDRNNRRLATNNMDHSTVNGKTASCSITVPVEHQPSTKPDYLRQRLQYTADGQALMDADADAVMMEWERPLMQAHAQVLMQPLPDSPDRARTVLNIGFGMGIIDSALQQYNPSSHVIIEAHPDVYKKMITDGWDKKPNVRICFGKWQDVMPQLLAEGVIVDAIFFDTYGEHYLDLEDFHVLMVQMLSKPHGVYSFFNGLAPDNLFFHGVACQCVKLQLSQLGLDSEFFSCEIQVKDEVWEGIRRKYWHGRDTYYLPQCTWNPQYLVSGTVQVEAGVEEARRKNDISEQEDALSKKQRFT